MTTKEKNELLDTLSVCYNHTSYLKTLCEENQETNEAAELEKREKELKSQNDNLLREIYKEWIGDAQVLKNVLDASNAVVEKCIKDVKADINTAERITKAIGQIDRVIELAKNMMA